MKVYEIVKASLKKYSIENQDIYNIVKNNLDVNVVDHMGLEFLSDWKLSILNERYKTNENNNLILDDFKAELLREDSYDKNVEIRIQDYASFANKMNELEIHVDKALKRYDLFMKGDLIMICEDAICRSGKLIDKEDFIRKVKINIKKNDYSINDLTNFKIS